MAADGFRSRPRVGLHTAGRAADFRDASSRSVAHSRAPETHVSIVSLRGARTWDAEVMSSRHNLALLGALFISLTIPSAFASAQSCDSGSESSVSDNGITFTFDRAYTCGRFANGDYWVAPDDPTGTVTLTAISPDAGSGRNGWEVNPADTSAHGFDDRIDSYDGGRTPSLPYAASGGTSIVKAVSTTDADCRPCLQSAAILTVVSEPPAGGGVELFRPPYFGTDKPLIETSQLQLDALPTVARIPDAPTLEEVRSSFAGPWLDHKTGWTGASIHPSDLMPEYGADVASAIGTGVLGLMFDDPMDDKRAAAIAVTQVGIDLYHAFMGGTSWPAGGGHGNGRKILLVLTAVLLGDEAMADAVQNAPGGTFSEDSQIWYSEVASRTLYGEECSEDGYWNVHRFGDGSRGCRDPYGYIDGGDSPADSYQACCTSSVYRGSAVALQLMPELRCVWPAENLLDYVDRWIEHGGWSQPDPCAPYDGNPDNYGVTYGPDGSGGCIADDDPSDGTGRFPDAHAQNANGAGHGSSFHYEMWLAYRDGAPTDHECVPLTPVPEVDGGVPPRVDGGPSGEADAGFDPDRDDTTHCSCRVGSSGSNAPAGFALFMATLGLAIRRSRRR